MAKFGNTGASSLVRSATASQNKVAAYNDAAAAAEFDVSAKTAEDFKKYSDYLTKRVKQAQNVDPTKALSLTRTLTSANRTFNSAEINRATTQVQFGKISNRDKYNQIAKLYEAAAANGDDNLAQSLYSRMASLSVTIQNEDQAAAAAGKANVNKTFNQAIGQKEALVRELKAAKLAGQITPAEYRNQMSQLYLGNPDTNSPGIIQLVQEAQKQTGDENGTFGNKLNQIASDAEIQRMVNGNATAQNSIGNRFGQEIVKQADGTYTFQDRGAGDISGSVVLKDKNGNPVKDAYGHVMTSTQYAAPQATTDAAGNITGFQYATNIDKNGNIAPGTGAGAIRKVGNSEIMHNDPSGVPYFINEAGQKKFIGKDPTNGRAIMANSPDVVNSNLPTLPDNTGNIGNSLITNPFSEQGQKKLTGFYGEIAGGIGKSLDATGQAIAGSPIGSWARNVPILGSLVARGQKAQLAQQKVAQEAAYQERVRQENARIAAQQVQQAKLLPVFQAPKPAAPIPTAKLPTFTPLPGQAGYQNGIDKALNTPLTGNKQKDIFTGIEAIRGGLNL